MTSVCWNILRWDAGLKPIEAVETASVSAPTLIAWVELRRAQKIAANSLKHCEQYLKPTPLVALCHEQYNKSAAGTAKSSTWPLLSDVALGHT